MIYYGYNGESTNVKTGLQYLRARYYDAENGTFTTEDDNLGTTEKPLTRNRYDYTTNNPVNYRDPTGHSLWKRIKRTVKKVVRKVARKVKAVKRKIANTVRRVAKRASTTTRRAVKRVVHTAKKTARTVSRTVRNTAKAVKNVATHPKQTYHAVRRSVAKGYQKVVSKGSRLVRSVSNGVEKVGKTYTSFKSYVAEETSKIRSEVVRQMCTTTNRITNQLGKVNWKNVAIGGASYSAVSSGLSGNNLNQVAQDTLSGGLTGAVTGGVLGGLTYGAGKAIGVVKDLVKGSSSSATSGHITEMATKNLSDIGNKSESQLDIGNGDPYELLKKHGIEPTLSEEERAAADAYGLVAKKSSSIENDTKAVRYFRDNNNKWHRENGQFASNEEVGLPSTKNIYSDKAHGNSLENARTNYGYALVDKDTNEILKFGETLNPQTRYSQKYLNEHNAVMKVIEEGTKKDIHLWQYDMNKYYESEYGEFPPLLKSKGW